MKISFYSTRGNVRKTNQDRVNYFQKNKKEFIAAICDGMGGAVGGEVAAELVIEYLISEYKIAPHFSDLKDVKKWFKFTLTKIQEAFKITINENQNFQEMATTIVCAIKVDKNIFIANIGDSRAYWFNKEDHKLEQITTDHNLPNLLHKQGVISKEQIQYHAQKNVLYNVFSVRKDFTIDWFTLNVNKGFLILMSDGVFNLVSILKLKYIMGSKTPIESKVVEICNEANDLGGFDNNSILIGDINAN